MNKVTKKKDLAEIAMSQIGAFMVFEINRILKQEQFYSIQFDNKIALAASKLHAFITIEDGKHFAQCTTDLKPGQWILVDTHAFLADESFYFFGLGKHLPSLQPSS